MFIYVCSVKEGIVEVFYFFVDVLCGEVDFDYVLFYICIVEFLCLDYVDVLLFFVELLENFE